MSKEFNGWTNYETWACNLWLTSDAESYAHVWVLAEKAIEEANAQQRGSDEMLPRSASYMLAKWLEEYVEGEAPDLGATLFSDLLMRVLTEINWYELAEYYVEARNEEASA